MSGNHKSWFSTNRRPAIGYLIVLVVFCFTIYRAFQQSITHDEARTYTLFVAGDWRHILLVFDSANHTLYSLLAKVSTTLFGVSEVSLRIPSLIGGLGFMLASERICRYFCRNAFAYVFTLLALVTNPFVLDYLVAARGYSLALCFFMWAFLLCCFELQAIDRFSGKESSLRNSCLISCLCALSVASNLAFALANVSLLAILLFWLALRQKLLRRESLISLHRNRILSLTIPGACLYFWINPAILRYDSATMYFGAGSWSAAYDSIIGALFDDFIPKLDVFGINQSTVQGLKYLPLFFAVFVLVGGLSILREFLIRHREGSSMENRSRFWVFVFSVLSLTIALHTALHSSFGVLLPLERTGIYFVPLSILLASVSIEGLDGVGAQRIARTLGRLGIALATIYFLSCLHTDYFRQWKSDAGSKDVFSVLYNLSMNQKYDSIGISWPYEPSLNFYRTLYQADNLPEFTRDPPNAHQSLFVLDPTSSEAQQFITEQNLRIIYQHPLSGAVVAIK